MQIDLVFGDAAADGRHIGRVERGVAGIAAEHAEDADALMRPTVVRWRSMASMARVMAVEKPMQYSVLRTSLSMVLGTAITFTPLRPVALHSSACRRRRSRSGSRAQRFDVLQHLRGDIEDGGVDAFLGRLLSLGNPALENGGSFFIFDGLVRELCRNVPPVRSTVRVFSRFRGQNVTRLAGRVVQNDVCQAFPSAPDADDLAADLGAAIDHFLDDGVQAGNVAASREDANALLAMMAPSLGAKLGSDNGSRSYLITRAAAAENRILRSRLDSAGRYPRFLTVLRGALLDLELQLLPISIDHYINILITL